MPRPGLEPRDPSNQAAADPRLRPRGHWDRLDAELTLSKSGLYYERFKGSNEFKLIVSVLCCYKCSNACIRNVRQRKLIYKLNSGR
jgi:Fe-S oxidoreductase